MTFQLTSLKVAFGCNRKCMLVKLGNLSQPFQFSEENWAELVLLCVFYIICHKSVRVLVRFRNLGFMTIFSQNFNIPLNSFSIQLHEPITIG